MLAKRIIPCLDVMNGRTVKGINFLNLRDAGDIAELAVGYSESGADELVFLDITASCDKRKTRIQWVERVAEAINIPFTVGGGITSEWDVEVLLNKGADKISVNSSAIQNPDLVKQLAYSFGKQCVVVAVDAKEERGRWTVYSRGGREKSEKELFDWVKEVEDLGAGEILFTSMNQDGTKSGYACAALARMYEEVSVPVIASGGAGSLSDFYDVFVAGKADAALAAGVFHYGELTITGVKHYLDANGVVVRI